MTTPICDFVNKYAEKNCVRLHMPGHKGKNVIGCETFDITEFSGADELYMPSGIIAESEKNASAVFGAQTFYSAGGSTLCIQAMLYLIKMHAATQNKKAKILSGRNAHKAFVNAAALLDIETVWIYPKSGVYHSGIADTDMIEKAIEAEKPTAVYITSPDYLGNISDIYKIAKVCRENNVILAVDNAHGAYLKFLPQSKHPIDEGADICCDSAHKTLPVLTGGAYLHIGKNAPEIFFERAKEAMALFGSSSPSYLILESLDRFNSYAKKYKIKLNNLISEISDTKTVLKKHGFDVIGDEPTKVTVKTKTFGYTGFQIAKILEKNEIYTEFCDSDFLVMMFSPSNGSDDIRRTENVLLSVRKRDPINTFPPQVTKPKRKLSPREAIFAQSEYVDTEKCIGRICAQTAVSCPPAVPIVVCGEIINKTAAESLKYYGIKKCRVICK